MREALTTALGIINAAPEITQDEAIELIDGIRAKAPRYLAVDLIAQLGSIEITTKDGYKRVLGSFVTSQDLSLKINGEEWGEHLQSATLRIRPNQAVILDLERIVR